MGCCLTRTKAKTHEASHQRHREELHYVDEYGQPIGMQVETRGGRGHRRRRSHCAVDCNGPTERHWEALRALGLMEGGCRAGSYYGHMMMSPDVYPPNGYLPRLSTDQHPGDRYLPSVSYSLDHLDRLEHQGPDPLPYQPTSESRLIGCYDTEELEPDPSPSQISSSPAAVRSDHRPPWRSDGCLGYLPLSELDSGLGCGPDSPPHRRALSEAETDAVSSLPGHTPSSQGSSSSSESLISSEPSDSGFHSVSTGEHRWLHEIHGSDARRQTHQLRSGLSPREQRGRWDLESIPETPPTGRSGAPRPSRCTVGNSTTTTVHFHRAERSPTLPRRRSPPSPATGCRTEPCQRRALWLEQRQGGGGTVEARGRSRTITDLSERQLPRRSAPPDTPASRLHDGNAAGPRSGAGPPGDRHRRTGPTDHRNTPRSSRSREEDGGAESPGSGSGGASDRRGFRTLGNRPRSPKGCPGARYGTLGAPRRDHRSPPSPRSRPSNQKSVRNQLLRARAHRLAREHSEVTTDEEARGGGVRGDEEDGGDGRLAGRYWNRTERRRHLASSRQQGERRGGEERAGGLQGPTPSQTVLELSRMKQNRLRNRKLLDGWTTVEELLAHGTWGRSHGQLGPGSLLSVTTV